MHFNPLPPCGGRHLLFDFIRWIANFNPLPPCGGRPSHLEPSSSVRTFQSTPSVWRETNHLQAPPSQRHISIHSLRVEGDAALARHTDAAHDFNPLPPCGGRRSGVGQHCRSGGISIHSLRVEGDLSGIMQIGWLSISIHSLRVEGDYHRRCHRHSR